MARENVDGQVDKISDISRLQRSEFNFLAIASFRSKLPQRALTVCG